jgi:hypothetical protein
MQKQQVFKIKPDAGLQAARLRTPGAAGGAKLIQNGKNGFQTRFKRLSPVV